MPFVISKFLEHGTSNPIVARLSLQTMRILDQCKIAQGTRDKITEIYVHSLQKKLIRCWEIEERFRSEFKSAVESYRPPPSGSQFVQIPQIPRLDEECHNFLYEMKNYVRDLLNVFNRLYGTDFKEASEFFRAKQGSKSLIEFARRPSVECSGTSCHLIARRSRAGASAWVRSRSSRCPSATTSDSSWPGSRLSCA